jgi:hypothetical protein
MQMLRQRDFWAGFMFVALGVLFVVGARSYNFGSAAKMGPGFFPYVLGLILAGLGVLTLVLSFFRLVDPVPAFVWRPLLVLIVAIGLFGFLLPRSGFVIASIVLVVVGSKADVESRWLESLALGIGLAIFSTLVFHYGLGLPFRLWPNL